MSFAVAVAGCSTIDLTGLVGGGGEGGSSPGDGGTSDSPGHVADSGTDVGPLAPGQIVCASTLTVCDIHQAQCCITLSGTSSAAGRSYTASSAKCGPIGGPGCSQFVSTGNDFTTQLPQRCGSAADCSAGESCCVLPLGSNRFAKEVSAIRCIPATECATTGRAICGGPADCAPTETCLPETDPILSHLYAKFCQ
jgi:hypothetical protein